MAAHSELEPVEVALRDGRKVRLRAAHSGDAGELLQAFERLSPNTRYMRFMRAVAHLDPGELHRTLERLPGHGFAVVATVAADDGIDIVGGASYFVGDDPQVCEFAITLVDGWEGLGLGRRLMETLIAIARQRGLRRMEGYVLATNQPMLRLAKALGFDSRSDPQDYVIRIVSLELRPLGSD